MKAFTKLRDYMTNEQRAKNTDKKVLGRQLLRGGRSPAPTASQSTPAPPQATAAPAPSAHAAASVSRPSAQPAYQHNQYSRAAPAMNPTSQQHQAATALIPACYPAPTAPSPSTFASSSIPASLPASNNYYSQHYHLAPGPACSASHQQPVMGYPMPASAVLHSRAIPAAESSSKRAPSKKDKRELDRLREEEKRRQYRELKMQYEYQQYKEQVRRDNGRQQFHTAGLQTSSSSMTALAILPEIFKAIF